MNRLVNVGDLWQLALYHDVRSHLSVVKCQSFQTSTEGHGFHLFVHSIYPCFPLPNKSNSHDRNKGEKKIWRLFTGIQVWWLKILKFPFSFNIHINGCESDYLEIKCGFPKGTILEPLLFLCCEDKSQLHCSKNSLSTRVM